MTTNPRGVVPQPVQQRLCVDTLKSIGCLPYPFIGAAEALVRDKIASLRKHQKLRLEGAKDTINVRVQISFNLLVRDLKGIAHTTTGPNSIQRSVAL